jgi:hypothetical protein
MSFQIPSESDGSKRFLARISQPIRIMVCGMANCKCLVHRSLPYYNNMYMRNVETYRQIILDFLSRVMILDDESESL